MKPIKKKVALPVVNNKKRTERTDYEEVLEPDAKCGSCMWLKNRRPTHDDACANIREEDTDGNVEIIDENSDTCKHYTSQTDNLIKLHVAMIGLDLDELKAIKRMMPGLIKDKETEKLEKNPVFEGDKVSFELIEGDEVVKYKGKVVESGRARILVSCVVPTADDPENTESIRIPKTLASLKVLKSANIEALGEGVRNHGKSSGDPEEIRKAKIRKAKRMARIVSLIDQKSKHGDKKVSLLVLMEKLEALDTEVVQASIKELRELKMVVRVDGKYKVTDYGVHTAKRCKDGNDVVATWYKLEKVAREKIAAKSKEDETESHPKLKVSRK